jgi:hypothetical protein
MDEFSRKKFWDEFIIPVQEETVEVAFANPSDVARSLIKSRNWAGTITQSLMDFTRQVGENQALVKANQSHIVELEREILGRQARLPSAAVKNKELQRAFARSHATVEEKARLDELEDKVRTLEFQTNMIKAEKEQIDLMKHALEKTTEWLIQYINWHKFEARALTE